MCCYMTQFIILSHRCSRVRSHRVTGRIQNMPLAAFCVLWRDIWQLVLTQ